MKTIKTLIATAAVTATFSISSAHANGFFNAEQQMLQQAQSVSFNSDAHKGTTFWGYYYSGHTTATVNRNTQREIASLDDSIVRNPYLAPLYN